MDEPIKDITSQLSTSGQEALTSIKDVQNRVISSIKSFKNLNTEVARLSKKFDEGGSFVQQAETLESLQRQLAEANERKASAVQMQERLNSLAKKSKTFGAVLNDKERGELEELEALKAQKELIDMIANQGQVMTEQLEKSIKERTERLKASLSTRTQFIKTGFDKINIDEVLKAFDFAEESGKDSATKYLNKLNKQLAENVLRNAREMASRMERLNGEDDAAFEARQAETVASIIRESQQISNVRDLKGKSLKDIFAAGVETYQQGIEATGAKGTFGGELRQGFAAMGAATRANLVMPAVGSFGSKAAIAGSVIGGLSGLLESSATATSGAGLSTVIQGAITQALGPIAGLIIGVFNRFNEMGKKGLELFEKTGGRYGYGEGFDQNEAQDFINFQQKSRSMAFDFRKTAEEIQEVFKGLNEYSGVKTFGQLEALAKATLKISNATGIAATEVTKLGAAYQKNFGYGAQEAVTKAGQQLLGLMNNINRGLTSNLLLTNMETAELIRYMMEGTQGADVSKTLIPFIDAAYTRIKALGIESREVANILTKEMFDIQKSGAGLPANLASFIVGTGDIFSKNMPTQQEAGIMSQVGRGKFAYEAAGELATVTKGTPEGKFWASPKLKLKGYADLAMKIKSNRMQDLITSQSEAGIAEITKRIFELYQIPGAEELLGVSLKTLTGKFESIARTNLPLFKALGGDIDKVTALSETAKAQEVLRNPASTQAQIEAAQESLKQYKTSMTPADVTNQFLEKILGLVDQIVIWMAGSMFFGKEGEEGRAKRRMGLTEDEYRELGRLQQVPERTDADNARLEEFRKKQNNYYEKTMKVDAVSGRVTEIVTVYPGGFVADTLKAGVKSGNNKN